MILLHPGLQFWRNFELVDESIHVGLGISHFDFLVDVLKALAQQEKGKSAHGLFEAARGSRASDKFDRAAPRLRLRGTPKRQVRARLMTSNKAKSDAPFMRDILAEAVRAAMSEAKHGTRTQLVNIAAEITKRKKSVEVEGNFDASGAPKRACRRVREPAGSARCERLRRLSHRGQDPGPWRRGYRWRVRRP